MSTLQDRLKEAMKPTATRKEITRSDIISAIKRDGGTISRAALSKWFDEGKVRTLSMKAEHVFPVARLCNVNPEWLATGRGAKERSQSANPDRLPAHRLALIQAYGSLEPDVRHPIRALIETLASATSEKARKFERELGERTVRAKATEKVD